MKFRICFSGKKKKIEKKNINLSPESGKATASEKNKSNKHKT